MGYAGQLRAIEEARDASEDPEEALLEMTRAYVRFALGCPDLYRVMYGLGVVSLPVGELRKEGEKIAETIAEVVGELLRKNGKPVEDVRDKLTLPWATLHGLLALRVSPDLPAEISRREEGPRYHPKTTSWRAPHRGTYPRTCGGARRLRLCSLRRRRPSQPTSLPRQRGASAEGGAATGGGEARET